VEGFLDQICEFENIKTQGLMTIAPLVEDPEETRPYFRELSTLFEHLKTRQKKNIEMIYLSMGMSQDFEIAIEEGSNMVRIGRAIFQGI
jgi:hypothetical protein